MSDVVGAVAELLLARGATVGVAESLTGGLLCAALSRRPGSSQVFRGGLVVYATDLKASLAGVPPDDLARFGAVSPQTAAALAAGARERLGADVGLGATGVAGPAEQEGQRVGTVHLAVRTGSGEGELHACSLILEGDRESIRVAAVASALDLLHRVLAGG